MPKTPAHLVEIERARAARVEHARRDVEHARRACALAHAQLVARSRAAARAVIARSIAHESGKPFVNCDGDIARRNEYAARSREACAKLRTAVDVAVESGSFAAFDDDDDLTADERSSVIELIRDVRAADQQLYTARCDLADELGVAVDDLSDDDDDDDASSSSTSSEGFVDGKRPRVFPSPPPASSSSSFSPSPTSSASSSSSSSSASTAVLPTSTSSSASAASTRAASPLTRGGAEASPRKTIARLSNRIVALEERIAASQERERVAHARFFAVAERFAALRRDVERALREPTPVSAEESAMIDRELAQHDDELDLAVVKRFAGTSFSVEPSSSSSFPSSSFSSSSSSFSSPFASSSAASSSSSSSSAAAAMAGALNVAPSPMDFDEALPQLTSDARVGSAKARKRSLSPSKSSKSSSESSSSESSSPSKSSVSSPSSKSFKSSPSSKFSVSSSSSKSADASKSDEMSLPPKKKRATASCEFCDKTLANRQSLVRHFQACKARNVRCVRCRETFLTPDMFNHHRAKCAATPVFSGPVDLEADELAALDDMSAVNKMAADDDSVESPPMLSSV